MVTIYRCRPLTQCTQSCRTCTQLLSCGKDGFDVLNFLEHGSFVYICISCFWPGLTVFGRSEKVMLGGGGRYWSALVTSCSWPRDFHSCVFYLRLWSPQAKPGFYSIWEHIQDLPVFPHVEGRVNVERGFKKLLSCPLEKIVTDSLTVLGLRESQDVVLLDLNNGFVECDVY